MLLVLGLFLEICWWFSVGFCFVFAYMHMQAGILIEHDVRTSYLESPFPWLTENGIMCVIYSVPRIG